MIKIYNQDVMKALKSMPDKSVDMQITSPPYWALRNYGVDGQLGLESTFDEYINKLCDIFDEVKRVLKDDGTCWVNLGDGYAGNMGKKSGWTDNKLGFGKEEAIKKGVCLTKKTKIIHQLPQKCLICIPDRFRIEMINRGWILRNKIIWYKPGCMPSSAKDRFTIDFEEVMMFTKKKKYYFEQQLEPIKSETIERNKYGHCGDGVTAIGRKRKPGEFATRVSKYQNLDEEKENRQGMNKDRGNNLVEKRNLPEPKEIVDFLKKWKGLYTYKQLDKILQKKGDCASHWFTYPEKEHGFAYPSKEDWIKLKGLMEFGDTYDKQMTEVNYEKDSIDNTEQYMRNKRCVWKINTQSFSAKKYGFKDTDHFATFPKALVRTPILTTKKNALIMDIFAGKGTTLEVARELGRDSIGIEINPDYVEIAKAVLTHDKKGNRNLHPEPEVIK